MWWFKDRFNVLRFLLFVSSTVLGSSIVDTWQLLTDAILTRRVNYTTLAYVFHNISLILAMFLKRWHDLYCCMWLFKVSPKLHQDFWHDLCVIDFKCELTSNLSSLVPKNITSVFFYVQFRRFWHIHLMVWEMCSSSRWKSLSTGIDICGHALSISRWTLWCYSHAKALVRNTVNILANKLCLQCDPASNQHLKAIGALAIQFQTYTP